MSFNAFNPHDEFTFFRELPVNVQLRVWFHALPRARVLTLKDSHVSHNEETDDPHYTFNFETFADQPIVLQICQQSRALALQYYKLAFGAINNDVPIYFNFQRDILDCADACIDFDSTCPGLLRDVKRVENLCSSAHHWTGDDLVLDRLSRFKNLKIMVSDWLDEDDAAAVFPEGVPMYEDFVHEAIVAIGMMAEGKGKEYEEPLVLYRDYSDIVQVRNNVNHWWTILEENDDSDVEGDSDDDGDDEDGDESDDNESEEEERGGD